MSLAINLVAVLLACFAAAAAVPPNFPHGKTLIYTYYGDVKAGTIEPVPYASQFAIEATLFIKHDTSDPSLKNAYWVALVNVQTGMYNGIAAHYEPTRTLKPITEAAKVIEQGFMIVYDENGKLEGVKIPTAEIGWSRNMKMAIASMLQLDLQTMELEEQRIRPRSFISKENTIYGDCWTTYDIHTKDQQNQLDTEIVVTKFSSPMNCTNFGVHEFNHVEQETCQVEKEEPMNVASRRVFEIEKQGEDILIKKLVAHGGSNYFPWNARSEAHYVLTNATFALAHVVNTTEINLPEVNFLDVPLIRDLTYRKPELHYATNAAVDVTQGRHVVNQETLVTKLTKMLGEAADYLNENHLEDIEPDWKHGQTINRILHTMSYMEVASFEQVFNTFRGASLTEKDATSKNIFIRMISKTGTKASCIFTLKLISEKKIDELMATSALQEMPMHVKRPDLELLEQMKDMLTFDDSIPKSVRMASVLCFSNFVYRTFKDDPNPKQNIHLQGYIRSFAHSFRFIPDIEKKLNYLMALSNFQVGGIPELLEHSVRVKYDSPEEIRLHQIWALRKPLENNYGYARELMWPIMADKTLPAKLRIAAYEILMHQAQTMTDVLRIYWFMVYEPNEHLYNYHYTTLQGIANSVDPCRTPLRELARKIMRFTRIHPKIPYKLSSAMSVGYKDEKYNHAERFETGMILNERTGLPEVMTFKHIVTEGRKPVINHEIRLQVLGCDEIISKLSLGSMGRDGNIKNVNVIEALRQAASGVVPKTMHVDIVVVKNGRIVLAKHFDWQMMTRMVREVEALIALLPRANYGPLHGNNQFISYEDLYEYQVPSDMGLPVVMETRVPFVLSFMYTGEIQPEIIRLEFNSKIWRHGDYSMSIYNPMSDVWHAVRRSTATDVSLPIHVSLSYNAETNTLKINYPRLPATKLSVGGARTHAKDCVTVTEDDLAALKQSCPTCSHQEVATRDVSEKKFRQTISHSQDTGLQYTTSIFDCENGLTSVTLTAEWYRAFMSQRKSTWSDWLVHGILATRQHMKNLLISPRVGSCGTLFKVAPSVAYPTSRIDLTLRGSYEKFDNVNPEYYLYGSHKHNLRGNIDVIAAATNTSARSWDFNLNVDLEQDHRFNTAKLHLTRRTPGETNLKICVDAQKNYPPIPADPLKLGTAKEEINSKVTIAVGRTNEDVCVRDDTLVTMTVKAELSDEQKRKYSSDIKNGACREDMKNPLYSSLTGIVPKTLNCLDEVLRYTTLRRYMINVSHKKVPEEVTSRILYFEDILRSYLMPNLEYQINHALPGTFKVIADFSMEKDLLTCSVITPTRSYAFVDVELEKPSFKGFGPVVKPVWQWPLDNTRFSLLKLDQFLDKNFRMCSVYPETVLTADGKNLPFALTDQWTLVMGDFISMNFAMFAKMVGTNMAVQIYYYDTREHDVEIMPNVVDNSIQVTVSGQVISNLLQGIVVPSELNGWSLRITKVGDHIYVRIKGVPLIIVHGGNHVGLAIDAELQGRVSGLCGHLDGSTLKTVEKPIMLPTTNITET